MAAYIWLAIQTKESISELCRDGLQAGAFLFAVLAVSQKGTSTGTLCWVCSALAASIGFLKFAWDTRKAGLGVAGGGQSPWFLVIMGAAFYFWEPIACMTNPPMEWSYPRTVEGFLARPEPRPICYQQAHPTDLTSFAGWKSIYM